MAAHTRLSLSTREGKLRGRHAPLGKALHSAQGHNGRGDRHGFRRLRAPGAFIAVWFARSLFFFVFAPKRTSHRSHSVSGCEGAVIWGNNARVRHKSAQHAAAAARGDNTLCVSCNTVYIRRATSEVGIDFGLATDMSDGARGFNSFGGCGGGPSILPLPKNTPRGEGQGGNGKGQGGGGAGQRGKSRRRA